MTVPDILLGKRAALTALAITSAITLCLVAGVLWSLTGGDAASQDEIQRLAVHRAEASARPQAERTLALARAQAASLPTMLQGESDALAQASLQSDVKAMVERAGGEVRSAFALPSTTDHGLDLIAVQYDVTIPTTKLRELAYALETHLPYLFITAAQVSGPQAWPTDAKAPEPQLELRWTVSAYRRASSP